MRDGASLASVVGTLPLAVALRSGRRASLALATLALLGHLAAPTLDLLWVGLLAVAFATIPAAALIGRST